MKKIYMTLAAILIVGMGFAQMESPVKMKEVSTYKMIPSQKVPNRNQSTHSKGTIDSYFYYLPDGLAAFSEGSAPTLSGVYMMPDSLAITPGNFRAQFYSMAQVFDFNDSRTWSEFFEYVVDENGDNIPAPDFRVPGLTFNIEKIGLAYSYEWGEEVPDDVVDTLLISIGTTRTPSIINLSAGSGSYCNMFELPYDIPSANIPDSAHRLDTLQQIRALLTKDDVDTEYIIFSEYELDVNMFKNLTVDDKIVVAYSFLPGSGPRDLTTKIGVDVNEFVGCFYNDPRDEYNVAIAVGTPELMNERNNSLCGMGDAHDPTYTVFYKKFVPMSIWDGKLKRPYIGLYLTSDDFLAYPFDVGVEDFNTQDITVRPNPATDKFTVTLPNNGSAQVELYNLVGQKVYSENSSSSTVEINVNQYNSGVYLLKVSQGEKVYTSKVIVK